MRKIISLICLLLPIAVYADELKLQENAPDRYVVVKGDTLWDISAKFFKDPWKWPQIWGYNKDTIKDPHWIYPGNIVYLDQSTHTLRVGEPVPAPASANTGSTDTSVTVPSVAESPIASDAIKLLPKARVTKGTSEAIPVISLKEIGPFLARPLVIEEDDLSGTPTLVGTYEQRQLLATGDVAYVQGLPSDKGERWQIYREDHSFKDPDTGEFLGTEVLYLGDAAVEKFDTLSTLRITNTIHEINKGDHLAQAVSGFSSNYLPHAPDKNISAKIISVYGGVLQAGQNSVVTINKGRRDGIENGHVLALFQKGEVLRNPGIFTPNTELPDVRYGLIFVFRVFDKVSYALVMSTRLPVQLLDRASTPE
jgi:LysM domain